MRGCRDRASHQREILRDPRVHPPRVRRPAPTPAQSHPQHTVSIGRRNICLINAVLLFVCFPRSNPGLFISTNQTKNLSSTAPSPHVVHHVYHHAPPRRRPGRRNSLRAQHGREAPFAPLLYLAIGNEACNYPAKGISNVSCLSHFVYLVYDSFIWYTTHE